MHYRRRYRLFMPRLEIPDECAMLTLGRSCGRALAHNFLSGNLESGCVLFLSGELGTGKTTLVRGMLSGLGFDGIVSSPTYTLVEPYTINQRAIYHFDLYRVKCAEELEMIGIRDLLTPETISLIEWPERGAGVLPDPDYEIVIQYAQIDHAQTGRAVNITNHNKRQLTDFVFND